MLNLRSSMCLEEYVMDTEASFASTADGFEDYVPFTSAALLGPPTSSPVDRVAPEADTEASFASTADGFEDYVPFTAAALLGPPTSSPRPETQLQPHQPAIAVQPDNDASDVASLPCNSPPMSSPGMRRMPKVWSSGSVSSMVSWADMADEEEDAEVEFELDIEAGAQAALSKGRRAPLQMDAHITTVAAPCKVIAETDPSQAPLQATESMSSATTPPSTPPGVFSVAPQSLASPPQRRCSSPDNTAWMRMRTPSPENTYSGYATGRAPPGPPGILLKSTQDLALPQQYTPVLVQQQCMPVLCYVCPSNMGVNGQADAESGAGSTKRQSLPSVASWSTMASEDDRGFEAEETQCLACGDHEVPESNFAMDSKGSKGHPYSCASACKYIKKTLGCKDGADCDRCHLCAFHNKSKKPGMSGRAQQKATVGW